MIWAYYRVWQYSFWLGQKNILKCAEKHPAFGMVTFKGLMHFFKMGCQARPQLILIIMHKTVLKMGQISDHTFIK